MQPYSRPPEDDCVEAEIVSGPGSGSGGQSRRENQHDYTAPRPEPVNIPFYGLFLKIKFIFVTAVLLISFGLIVLGLILTSTVIGAIIGIPLLVLGGLCLWLLFKLLTFGQKTNPIKFRRF